jgi:hypothetical protein
MKYCLISIILIFLCQVIFAQNTLLVEKIGTSRKYYYHLDDKIKLRTISKDSMIFGKLTTFEDSAIYVSMGVKPIPLSDVASVYKQNGFPRRFGKNLCIASAMFFGILTINNLLNHRQVFPPYTFIISGACLAGGLISLSFAESNCKIGNRWKLKILEIPVR